MDAVTDDASSCSGRSPDGAGAEAGAVELENFSGDSGVCVVASFRRLAVSISAEAGR